ncbi:hypothetical protein TNCV_1774371 [Trichonephila clavipes]|nr:hypothetical protein TNCV_1774371 [Trichonephila clavipes]
MTRTHIANGLIGRCPDTDSNFTMGLSVFLNHRKAPGRKTSGIMAPITCVANDTHLPTPPFGVVSRTTKLDCNGMEPGRLQ